MSSDNYTLTPSYSIDEAGNKHIGSDITYNIGDVVYWKISFVEDGSIVCSDIDDVRGYTVLGDQIQLDEQIDGQDRFVLTVDSTNCRYSFENLNPLPDVTVYDRKTDAYLVKGVDYYMVTMIDTDSEGNGVVGIEGIINYAGTLSAPCNIQKGIITADIFDSASDSYNPDVHFSTIRSHSSNSGLQLAYRTQGWTAEDIEKSISLDWSNYPGNCSGELFAVSAIYDASMNKIDTIQGTGTFYVTLVHSSDATWGYGSERYFDTSDDFSYTCEININPVNLTSNTTYTDGDGATWEYRNLVITPRLTWSWYMVNDEHPAASNPAFNYIYIYNGTSYAYTGNPVIPHFWLITGGAPSIIADFSELEPYTIDQDAEIDTYIAGYGTTGPIEPNDSLNPYVVSKISAKEGSTKVTGSCTTWYADHSFSIVAADISDSDVVTTTVDSAYYTGDELTPKLRFYVDGKECNYVEGEDYEVSYSNNVKGAAATDGNPPTATITILNQNHLTAHDADGNVTTQVSVPFSITYSPVALSDAAWTFGESSALVSGSTDGTLVEPAVSATYTSTDGTQTTRTVPEDAYTVETGTLDGTAFTTKTSGWKAGDQVWYRVTANGTNPAFTGSSVLNAGSPATVTAASAANSLDGANQGGSSLTVGFSQSSCTYTAGQIAPTVAVYNGLAKLLAGYDYAVTYGKNLNVADGGTATVVGKGAYTGSCTISFSITQASLSECAAVASGQVFCGTQLTPDASNVEVTLSGTALQASDWTVDPAGYGTNINAGSGAGSLAVVPGTSGNVVGSLSSSFDIERLTLTSERFTGVQTAKKTYDGTALTLGADEFTLTDSIIGTKLVSGTDYTLNYSSDHTSAGTHEVWVTGLGNYQGTITSSMTIGTADISDAVVSAIPDQVYTGATVTPTITVTLTNGRVLDYGDDYKVTATNAVNVASSDSENPPTATVVPRNNYSALTAPSGTFSIVPATMNAKNTTVTLEKDSYTYTGAAIEPKATVKLNGVTLPESDYTVTYAGNTAVGDATVTVTANGPNLDVDASTSVSATFKIGKASLSDATVSAIPDQSYAFGAEIKPALVITNAAGTVLTAGVDYEAVYSNNTKIGSTAKVTVTGIGAYEGSSTSASFKVVKIPIATDDITLSSSTFVYDGAVHKPDVTIAVGGKTLVEGTDYTLSYLGDAKSAGSQVIEVKVPTDSVYSSSATATYQIVERSWKRLFGDTALDTMSAIVEAGFDGTGGTVVLATGSGYWDALTASGIAGLADAPVLLTSIDGGTLSSQTSSELSRLKPSTLIVCGGTGAVSDSVVSQAQAASGATRVARCSGENAVGTANDIFAKAKEATGETFGDTAFVATNDGYWDALAIAPYAYSKGCPIFLSNASTSISDETLATMKDGGIKNVYIVGGTAAVSDNVKSQIEAYGLTVVDRLWGNTAVETSSAIAAFELGHGMSADGMAVATTDGYWDALTGAALCGKSSSVLVLTNDSNRSAITGFIAEHIDEITHGYVFGGESAVSANTYNVLLKVSEQ